MSRSWSRSRARACGQIPQRPTLRTPCSRCSTTPVHRSSAGMDYYLTYDDRMNAQSLESLRQFARTYIVGRPRVIGVLAAPTVVDTLAAWLRGGARRTTP